MLRLTAVALLAGALTTLLLYTVLDGGQWFLRSLGALGLIAAVGAGGRLARFPRSFTLLAQVVTCTVYVTALYASEHAYAGFVPGPDAFRALGDATSAGFDQMERVSPPVTPTDEVTLITVTGVALMGVLVDALAAGYRQVAWTGLPLLALYIVPAAVLPDGVRGALFLLPALGYLMLLLTESRDRLRRWGVPIGERSADRSAGEINLMSRRIGVTVLSMSIAIPALAPRVSDGFGEGGIGNDPTGGKTISTLNPLVTLRQDLTRGSDLPLMRVRSDSGLPDELYLRTVTLDTFDGEEWRAGRREVSRFEEGLPDPVGLSSSVMRTPVRTDVEVTPNFASDYVPLPYPATELEIDGEWRVDPLTGNVVSHSGREQITENGYSVNSLDLAPGEEDVTGDYGDNAYLAQYLELPSVPQRVQRIAERLTENAKGPLAKGTALQAWFRDPDEFTYNLNVSPGTSGDALVNFLDAREGWCEQFAATMAVMARAVGIPSRVNVGFTAGDLADNGLDRIVSAYDAHAWPELFLPGVGWTRFEPTPGDANANPSVPAWLQTQEPEQRPVEEPAGQEPESDEEDNGSEGSGGGSEGGRSENAPAPVDCAASGDCGPGGLPALPEVPQDSAGPWVRLALLGVVLLVLLVVPGVARVLIRGRRWAAATPGGAGGAARVAETAWRELRDSALDLGYAWPEARTPRQTSVALAAEGRLGTAAAAALHVVTGTVERARYAPGGSPATDRATLRRSVNAVRRDLGATAGRRARIRAVVFPRSVFILLAGALTQAGARLADARRGVARTLRPRRSV